MSKGKNAFLLLLLFFFSQDLFMKITDNVKIPFWLNVSGVRRNFCNHNIFSVLDEKMESNLSMRNVIFYLESLDEKSGVTVAQ